MWCPVAVYAAGGAGVSNADLVVYVVANQANGCPDGAAAWALSCDYDTVTLRPTFATINICPYTMDPDSVVEANLATIVHELMHSLVGGHSAHCSVCSV